MNFQMPRPPSWQGYFLSLFSNPVGRINIHFEPDDIRNIPLDCREPKDGDRVIGDFRLAVTEEGYLNVSLGDDFVTPFTGMEARTLQDCFIAVLQEIYMETGEHWESLHPSWHNIVEPETIKHACWDCNPNFDCWGCNNA